MGIKATVTSWLEGLGPKVPGAWSAIGDAVSSYDPAQRVLPEPYEPWVSTNGIPVMDPGTPLELLTNRTSVEAIWRTQPNVRKIVDFIASNLATIPLNLYDRVDDTTRVRVTDDPVARVLRKPVPGRQGYFRHWHRTLSDWLLYDRWLNVPILDQNGQLVSLQYVPAWRTRFLTDELNNVTQIMYWQGGEDKATEWLKFDPDVCLFDHGYSPAGAGTTPMETLKEMLDEQRESVRYRRTIWRNGFLGPLFISRPVEALEWAPGAKERFITAMKRYKNGGAEEGGIPLLEDGMKLEANKAYSLKDAEDLAGRQLSAVEVDNLFHIPPELVGDRPGNYSNVDAYRQQLYRDNMGPYVTAWEQAVDTQLLHITDPKGRHPHRYVEANLDVKLRGSFEQRADQMQKAGGRPWLTLNELRAMDNRPPVEGGDEVLAPLNMGQATQGAVDGGPVDDPSPKPVEDAAPKAVERPAAKATVKNRAPDGHDRDTTDQLVAYFKRQRTSVVEAIRSGKGSWWDSKRWDKELASTLLDMSLGTAKAAARAALKEAGMDPNVYDVDRTVAFLREAAKRNASNINDTTKAQLDDALDDTSDDDEDEPMEPEDKAGQVFTQAEDVRAGEAALVLVTFASGFGTVEAGRQTGAGTKTWHVTSSNPRASHAAMDGETVGLDDDFSNGLKWPGAGGSDADESAGCQCSVSINFGD